LEDYVMTKDYFELHSEDYEELQKLLEEEAQ
jgi:hypothetical protein